MSRAVRSETMISVCARDVIAVRVRDEGEAFRVRWVEPEILLWQINAALVLHRDHEFLYARRTRSETVIHTHRRRRKSWPD